MVVAVRLLADFGLDPFWIDDGSGMFDAVDPEQFQRLLQLPDHVMQAFRAWDDVYQAIMVWDDPMATEWPSEAHHRRYHEQGREACRLLRRHIPAHIPIRYCADAEILAEYF